MKNELFLVRYYWDLLLRRPLHWLLPMAVVIAAGSYVVMQQPRSYVSFARVSAQSPQVSGSLVQSIVSNEQVQFFEQRVFSRENLIALANRLTQEEARTNATDTQIAEALRRQITLQVTPTNPHNPASNSAIVAISFEAATPEAAAKGADEVIQMMIEEHRSNRLMEASEMRAFLELEVLDRKQQAMSIARELNSFVAENEALLPSRLVMYTSEVQELQQELQTIQLAMATLAADGRVLETQLALASRPVLSEESQLAELRTELSTKQTVYSDTHPDIVSLRSRIEGLEASLAEMDGTSPAVVPAVMTADSAGATMLGERVVAIQHQQDEYAARRAQIDERLAALRGTIAQMPSIEASYLALQRRHTLAEANLADMQSRLDTALIGERLEDAQVASHISVIDKPDVPVYPAGSGRTRTLMIIAGLSMAAGLGCLVALDFLRGTINSKRALEPLLEGGDLVLVPDWKPKRNWGAGLGLLAFAVLAEPEGSLFVLQNAAFSLVHATTVYG